MQSLDSWLLAIGLNVDSAVLGMSLALIAVRSDKLFALKWSIFFGGFQSMMYFLGFYGFSYLAFLHPYSHYLAASVFFVLGLKLLVPAFLNREESVTLPTTMPSHIFFSLSISVDAFFSSVAGLRHDWLTITHNALLIGVVGFCMTFISVLIAGRVKRGERKASLIMGGFLLIFLGVKSLL